MISKQLHSAKSLKGVRILVGRARHQAGSLSRDLKRLGAEVIEIPFIEIRKPRSHRPLDSALRQIDTYDWLILTSVNGVDALWTRLRTLGLTKRALKHLQVAAIGPATKKAIESHGLKVHLVPDEYIAESVVESLRNKVRGKRILLARAKVARDVIPRELRKLGAEVNVVEAYETVRPETSRIRLRRILDNPKTRPHAITFTSSSTARNFLQLLKGVSRRKLAGVRMASIGPVTSDTLRELKLRADIQAREYTMQGLINALVTSFNH